MFLLAWQQPISFLKHDIHLGPFSMTCGEIMYTLQVPMLSRTFWLLPMTHPQHLATFVWQMLGVCCVLLCETVVHVTVWDMTTSPLTPCTNGSLMLTVFNQYWYKATSECQIHFGDVYTISVIWAGLVSITNYIMYEQMLASSIIRLHVPVGLVMQGAGW